MLSEKRKADREKMAGILEKLLAESRASYKRIDGTAGGYPGPRCIRFAVSGARGAEVTIDLDGDSPMPDRFMLHWCMSSRSDARFSDAFGMSRNRHHFAKATDYTDSFEELCEILRVRLAQCADGSAFSAEREAASIAKWGTAAERQARFDKYITEAFGA